jgi:hypothetical protein
MRYALVAALAAWALMVALAATVNPAYASGSAWCEIHATNHVHR